MDGGTKAKAGLAGVGVLAALVGFMDDCGRLGGRAAMSMGDDVARVGAGVGRYGDDVAGFGAGAGRYGDDLTRLGARSPDTARLAALGVLAQDGRFAGSAAARAELSALRASSWDDLALGGRGLSAHADDGSRFAAEVATEGAGWSVDAADLLLGARDDQELPELVSEGALDLDALSRLRRRTVSRPHVAAIAPLGDADLREPLQELGITLLDAPSSFADALAPGPVPLLVVARAAPTDGAVLAPDGTELDLEGLMRSCREAGGECVVLASPAAEPGAVIAAADVARRAVTEGHGRTERLLAAVIRQRNDDASAAAVVIHRLTDEGDPVHSRLAR